MYYDNPGGRPQSAHMTRTGSRTGFGQRESIGNPLNLSLGRIRPMSASTSRTSFVPGASAKSDHSAPPPPMYAKEEPQVQSGYFVPAREAGASLRFFAYFEEPILQYNSRSVPYHTNRIHKCIITFHPKDATVGVDEPKVRNSGYMQGKLLKRSHVKHPDGRKFTPGDFVIGEERFGSAMTFMRTSRLRRLGGARFSLPGTASAAVGCSVRILRDRRTSSAPWARTSPTMPSPSSLVPPR